MCLDRAVPEDDVFPTTHVHALKEIHLFIHLKIGINGCSSFIRSSSVYDYVLGFVLVDDR